jgi:hypothetical protein
MPDSTWSARSEATLYEALASPVPAGTVEGETLITRRKETVDNDAESVFMGMMLDA